GEQSAGVVLDPHRHSFDLPGRATDAGDGLRELGEPDGRSVGVEARRPEREHRTAGLAHAPDDPPVTAGRLVPAGPIVALLDLPRGEDHLVDDADDADRVDAPLVGPDPRR